ncbi:hypothetical protein ACQP04_04915 [Pseudonocardia halophobica]|uniref:hypothetical protein n=1 Tax=Pseudonocardia halophobica TaxID=29401 RepID=UPI003D8BCD1F
MGSSRRGPAAIAATLSAAVRGIRRVVRAADPARPATLALLRDSGWQLTQLTGELTDLAALLAEHTGRHLEHAEQVRHADGEPGTPHLARACRDLAGLRQALDNAHTAACEYYTEISQLSAAPPPGSRLEHRTATSTEQQ